MFPNENYIKTALNGIASRFKKIEKQAVQGDWRENDKTKGDYIKNRTHYEEDAPVVLTQSSPGVEWDEATYDTKTVDAIRLPRCELTVGEQYIVTINGKEYQAKCVHGYASKNNLYFIGFNLAETTYPYPFEGDNLTDTMPFTAFFSAGQKKFTTGESGSGELYFAIAQGFDIAIPATVSISKMTTVVYSLDKKYLPNSAILLEDGALKSPDGGDMTANVKDVLSGNDYFDVIANITQDGTDSDGNPIYKSDKTFAELKAAIDANKIVGFDIDPHIEAMLDWQYVNGVGTIPVTDVSDFEIGSRPEGRGLFDIDAHLIYDFYIPQIYVFVASDNYVGIDNYSDVDPFYVVPQTSIYYAQKDESSGEITCNLSFNGFNEKADLYQNQVDFRVMYNMEMYIFNGVGSNSAKFVHADDSGIKMLTLSNDGGADKWTYSEMPTASNMLFVTITKTTVNGVEKFTADKTYYEIVEAVKSGALVFCKWPDVSDTQYGPHDVVLPYVLNHVIPNNPMVIFSAFDSQYRYNVTITDTHVFAEYESIVMRGATETSYGINGFVPQPVPGDQDKFLRGSGGWASISQLPSVAAADNGKILKVVDGQWAVVDPAEGTT